MSQKINLMYLVQSFSAGGAENLTVILSKELKKSNINPMVCALEGRGPLVEYLKENNIPCFHLGKKSGKDPWVLIRLWQLIRRNKIDILHTQNIGPLIYGYFGTQFGKRPLLVHTEHTRLEMEIEASKKYLYYVYGLMLNRVDAFVSIAFHISEYVERRFGISSDKVVTIPNGVDLNRFKLSEMSYSKNEFLKSEKGPVLGIVAGLRREKDHSTLIEALKEVSRIYPEIKLLIVGSGQLEKELRQKVEDLNLNRNVWFLGHRSDIPAILNALDLFVLTSLYEGLPLCLLEAMAAGKPVVATRVYGNVDVIEDGVTGLLVPPKNPVKLAEAILELLVDRERMANMGNAGRKVVEENYDLNEMVEAYKRIYIKLIRERRISR